MVFQSNWKINTQINRIFLPFFSILVRSLNTVVTGRLPWYSSLVNKLNTQWWNTGKKVTEFYGPIRLFLDLFAGIYFPLTRGIVEATTNLRMMHSLSIPQRWGSTTGCFRKYLIFWPISKLEYNGMDIISHSAPLLLRGKTVFTSFSLEGHHRSSWNLMIIPQKKKNMFICLNREQKSTFFFNFLRWQVTILWRHWCSLFWTSVDFACRFQSQGQSIIACALPSLACNDPPSQLWA